MRAMLSRFVGSAGAPRDKVLDDPALVEDIRCIVRLRGDRELVIATELGGGIRVFQNRECLAQRARSQLSFHDVASSRVLEIDADELYIFDLQTLEMLPDAPGLNDALYLYGAMRGPHPARLDGPEAPVDGQLTVTRADLLAGLIAGHANAFCYAPDQHGSRCIHALLPGERADQIAAGRGIVLALPLVPGWMLDSPVPNDLVVAQILHDVLRALRTDGLGADAPPLPVPDRAAFERQLVAAGWRIEGDEAVRAKGRGIIGSLLKGEERRRLPRQGTVDELIEEAKVALSKIPGTPTPEAAALQRRTTRSIAPPPVANTPHVPVTAPTPSVVVPPSAAPRPRVESDRTEWMKDFVDAHRSPSRPAPIVSTPASVVSSAAKPSWMDDFDGSEDDAPDPEPARRPDWSKDFD